MKRLIVGGYYIVLGIIAAWMWAMGFGAYSLLIFIYPTVLWITYFVLDRRLIKARAERSEAERRYQVGRDIVHMVTSNDEGPVFFAETLDSLEENCARLGIMLHCDMHGYFR